MSKKQARLIYWSRTAADQKTTSRDCASALCEISVPEKDALQAAERIDFLGTLPDGIDGAKPHPGHGVTIQYANGRTREVRS